MLTAVLTTHTMNSPLPDPLLKVVYKTSYGF
jgi:hypothetical protein